MSGMVFRLDRQSTYKISSLYCLAFSFSGSATVKNISRETHNVSDR